MAIFGAFLLGVVTGWAALSLCTAARRAEIEAELDAIRKEAKRLEDICAIRGNLLQLFVEMSGADGEEEL